MRFSSRTWSVISLALFASAILCLWLDRRLSRPHPEPVAAAVTSAVPASAASAASGGAPQAAASPSAFPLLSPRAAATTTATGLDKEHGYRLVNTSMPLDELSHRDTAILLENAFLDATGPVKVSVPGHLRASADPGGWLVHLDRPLDRAFYDALAGAGAEFVGYVPNNTALVRAGTAAAGQLETIRGVQQVLPFEPAYKLARKLLPLAVDQEPLEADTLLKVLGYQGREEQARVGLASLGAATLLEDRSPFGPVFTVKLPADRLAELAVLGEVQRVEVASSRALLNDLTRVRMGVSPDPVTNATYLGLTGEGIFANVNDSGVDTNHPALTGRVTVGSGDPDFVLDVPGHGTHVTATLAGSGALTIASTNVQGSLTNAQGSVTNALFTGMAPKAEVHVLPVGLEAGPLVSDSDLVQAAAAAYYVDRNGTNLLISNNSWAYRGAMEYDLSAASFDAASRDAMPDRTGPQPILFVFAAGNDGFGSDVGTEGTSDSISSPATAKNVITVGAVELPRGITNFYTLTNYYFLTNVTSETTTVDRVEVVTTNAPFAAMTDSSLEIASYSSRGNVGIGREGKWGRFKPDVVAPGTFLISARSKGWELTNAVPTNSVFYPLWTNLVADCEPGYRYESGTSMSAPVVSGMLVLMQEFFERQWHQGCPPALLKALLINGARPADAFYDITPSKYLNHQGWGLANLTNALPATLTNSTDAAKRAVRFFADPSTNVLATGQAHTWKLTLNTNETEEARFLPLRITLVWTDPPGNPSVSLKLVNDLDLVVTNLDTGEVYLGNHFEPSADFSSPEGTNSVPVSDNVNNVENVFLAPTLGTNYSVSVVARRVNVNAVTANVTDVVQDYALVISAGAGMVTNPIIAMDWQTPGLTRPKVEVPTNGITLEKRRAGANFQLVTGTNGVSNQWAFFAFTNRFFTNQNFSGYTNGSNVAIAIVPIGNLALPRNDERQSDLDLYVTTNVNLLDFDPVAIAAARKSLNRGGEETLLYTNASTNDVFYIGVKAEDQQAVEFDLTVLSTDEPFDQADEFGNIPVTFTPRRMDLPDGAPDNPQGYKFTGFTFLEQPMLRTYAMLDLRHESVGDVQGILSHGGDYVALQNHNRLDGGTNFSLVYDDNPQGSVIYGLSRPSDGPGSLQNFLGMRAAGPWIFQASDDARGGTGSVERIHVRYTPHPLWTDAGINGFVLPNDWAYYLIDVPLGVTALRMELSQIRPALPLELYLRRDLPPTFDDYDKKAVIPGTGGSLTLSIYDVPPLNPGRYFIGIYNPNLVRVDFNLKRYFEFDLNAVNRSGSVSTNTPAILSDDAVTRSSIFVNDPRRVVDLQVGLRVEHPRVSDLAFHLVSPTGARVLLAENRGGPGGTAYGATTLGTNVASLSYSGGPQEFRTNIGVGVVEGTVNLTYQFYQLPDTLRVYYEGRLLFDTGLISGQGTASVRFGPGVSTNVTVVMNEGGSSLPTTAWELDASVIYQKEVYAIFTEQTNLQPELIKFASPPYTNSPGSVANTNRLVFDEDFERFPAGTYKGGLVVGPWELGPGGMILHGPTNLLGGITAASGSNYVEFVVSTEPSGLTTDLATVRGSKYITHFQTHSNPTNVDSPQSLGLYVDGVLLRTVTASPGSGWATNEIVWRAVDQRTRLEFRTTSPAGMLLDDIQISEMVEGGEAYFLPEEQMLKPLLTGTAFGNWTLEITDSRAGAVAPVLPNLLSWTLSLVFANTNPPATLLLPCTVGSRTVGDYEDACTLRTNTVAGDEIKYFIVEVPLAASFATNDIVTGADLVVLFNQNGIPTGLRYDDSIIDAESFVLTTNGVPPLVPGQRYYLGIANKNIAETNTFTISVTFDQIDVRLPNVPVLTNGVPVSTNAPASGPLGPTNSPPGSLLQYYQFLTGSNATHVVFQLFPTNGNLDLFARLARPIVSPLPRPNPDLHDYASTNASTNAEEIIITRRSIPQGLEPGTPWYLAVQNLMTSSVPYTIVANAYSDLATLQNGVATNRAAGPGSRLQFSEYVVGDFATDLTVTLNNTGTNAANFYIRHLAEGPQPLPRTNLHDYAFAVPAGGSQTATIDLGSVVPLQPGVWYFGVENLGASTNTYTLTVLEQGDAPLTIVPLTDSVPVPWTLATNDVGLTYFQFDIAAPNPAAVFEVYNLTQPVDVFLSLNSYPDPLLPAWTATGDASNPAQIVLRTSSGSPPDLQGVWYLFVRPQGGGNLDLTVRAAVSSGGVLTSGLPLNVTLTLGGGGALNFAWNTLPGEKYQIDVSTDLVTWTTVDTLTAIGSTATWADPSPPGLPMRFYRILQVP